MATTCAHHVFALARMQFGVRSPTTAEFVRNTRIRSSAGGYTRRAASEAGMAWPSFCTGTLERRRRWGERGQIWVTGG